MADITCEWDELYPPDMRRTFRDMGDGTHAEVVAVGEGSIDADIGNVDPNRSSPTIYNVTLTVANTEYSQAMPYYCRGFEFQCRTEHDIRFAFQTGYVATPTAPYMTLKAGDYYYSPDISQDTAQSTLYFASATAGAVVEIVSWS